MTDLRMIAEQRKVAELSKIAPSLGSRQTPLTPRRTRDRPLLEGRPDPPQDGKREAPEADFETGTVVPAADHYAQTSIVGTHRLTSKVRVGWPAPIG